MFKNDSTLNTADLISIMCDNHSLSGCFAPTFAPIAGLPHMHFHDLRHSVVTLLLSVGVGPRSIQDFVSHKDITTTLGIYGHMLPSMQQRIVDKLDDFFGEGRS